MTSGPQAPRPETEPRYSIIFSRQARSNLHEDLPLDVAAAAMETIDGPLTTNPHRVGKPLDVPSTATTPLGAEPIASFTGSTRTSAP